MSKSPSEEGLFFFVFFLSIMLGFNPGISF